jgi:hypothetical protein
MNGGGIQKAVVVEAGAGEGADEGGHTVLSIEEVGADAGI